MRRFFKLLLLVGAIALANGSVASDIPRKDTLTNEDIIRFSVIKLEMLVKNNRMHESANRVDSLNYVLNIDVDRIGTPDFFDTYPNATYIKQQRPDNVSESVAPYMLDATKLEKLNDELVAMNQQQQIKTYMLLVNFVPMVIEDTADWKTIADVFVKMYNDQRIGDDFKKDSILIKTALNQGADIVKGITKAVIDASTEKMMFLGFVKFKTLYKKTKAKQLISIYYPNSKLLATETGYRQILKRNIDGEAIRGTPDQEVEKLIAVVKKTNELYSAVESLNGTILGITDPDIMEDSLSKLFEDSYAIFDLFTRVHIIKVLSSQDIEDSRETMINDVIATTPLKDYDGLLDSLLNTNNLAPEEVVIFTRQGPRNVDNPKYGFNTLNTIIYNTEDAECFFCWGEHNYQRLIKNLLIMYGKSKQFKTKLLALYELPDADFAKRKIIWDKSYFLSFKSKPEGTFEPIVTYNNTTGEVTFHTKEMLAPTCVPVTVTEHDGMARVTYKTYKCTDNYHITDPTTLGPFDMITLTDRSDLSMLQEVMTNGVKTLQSVLTNNAMTEIYAPAILLKYADDKRWNKDAFKAIDLGINVLTILLPAGQVAFLGKTINFIYKTIEVATKIGAGLQILYDGGALDAPELKAVKAFVGQYNRVVNLLGLVNLAGSLADMYKTAKYQRLVKAEAMKYFDDLYEAESKMLNMPTQFTPEKLEDIYAFSRTLEEMGKAAGYGEDWTRLIRQTVLRRNGLKQNKIFDELLTRFGEKVHVFEDPASHVRYLRDAADNNIVHMADDGKTLYVDAVGDLATGEGKVLSVIDDEFFVPNGATSAIKDDLLLFEKADGAIVCVLGACFVKGTGIHTKSGIKVIENIKTGDVVLSYDEQKKKNAWQKVSSVFSKKVEKLVRVITGGETIVATPEHPFYTPQGWKSAKDLARGLQVKLATGVMAAVLSATPFDSVATVYNFEVDSTHNYYVGAKGVLVHNDCSIISKIIGKVDESLKQAFVNDFKDVRNLALLKKMEANEGLIKAWTVLQKRPNLRVNADLLGKIDDVLSQSSVQVEKLTKALENVFDNKIRGLTGVEKVAGIIHKFRGKEGIEKVITSLASTGPRLRNGAGFVLRQADLAGVGSISRFEYLYLTDSKAAADFLLTSGKIVDCKSWDIIASINKIPEKGLTEQLKRYFRNGNFEMWFDFARFQDEIDYALFSTADALTLIKERFKTLLQSGDHGAYSVLANSAYLKAKNIADKDDFINMVGDINSGFYDFIQLK